MPAADLEQIVNLCKRRGFVYPSAEIYGGFRSSYDYGPLGSLMLRNVKDAWVRAMVQERDDVMLIDAAILGPHAVFEASGHLANFSDPLVDCTVCKKRFREDQLGDRDCPQKMKGCTITEARAFNLMFKSVFKKRSATFAPLAASASNFFSLATRARLCAGLGPGFAALLALAIVARCERGQSDREPQCTVRSRRPASTDRVEGGSRRNPT